jgi:hypothetical protein
MSDKAVALVTQACNSKFPSATAPSPKNFAMKELLDVYVEGTLYRDTIDFTLYNGSAIELSEVTFGIRTRNRLHKELEEIRYYRAPVDLKPLQTTNVSVKIIIDGGLKGFALLSAKGVIRRGDITTRSGS